jgi:hypothetical protein
MYTGKMHALLCFMMVILLVFTIVRSYAFRHCEKPAVMNGVKEAIPDFFNRIGIAGLSLAMASFCEISA